MGVSKTTRHSQARTNAGDMPAAQRGHKCTDAGMIPQDWVPKQIRDIAPLQRGFDLPTSRLRPGAYPVVYSNGVLNHHDQAMAKGPGIITGRSGTIGKVHFIEDDYWPHNTALWVTSLCGNDPKFVYYLYTYIDFTRFSSGSGVPTLNRNDVHQHVVPCPPPPEQRAIAGALSDVDRLIGALGKLIAKKRGVKLAAMQQLLTGKTRLPGFSGEWEVKQIRDLLNFERPDKYIVHDTEYSDHADVPVLTANKSFILGYTDECFGVLDELPAIVFDDFTTDIKYADFPFKVKSSAIKILKLKSEEVNLRYVFERMQLIEFSHRDHKRYYLSEYQYIELPIPGRAERNAIISILSDMDAEIAALERRRDKVKALQRGMMQELLTGRIRLIKPENAQEVEA